MGGIRVRGELAKLGIRGLDDQHPDATSRERTRPGSRRTGPAWGGFIKATGEGILALDFFTVETV
jgi:hypothetical protein